MIPSSENVYWLESSDSPAAPMPEEPAPAAQPGELAVSQVSTSTLHLEQNQLYAPQPLDGDRWFWVSLPATSAQVFELLLDNLAPLAGLAQRLRVAVWGSTESSASPDHHLRLLLNRQCILDASWDGQGYKVLEAEIPDGLLVEGQNTLGLQAPGDTGDLLDTVFLNWIELEYARRLVAVFDLLEFTGAGMPVSLSGFSGPADIFDITNLAQGIHLTGIDTLPDAFLAQKGRRYLAAGPHGYRPPDQIQAAQLSPDLHSPMTQAGYIAIGPPALLEPLKPLFLMSLASLGLGPHLNKLSFREGAPPFLLPGSFEGARFQKFLSNLKAFPTP